MYELTQVLGNTWYIDCPAKIGLWVQNNEAWLVDSGSDKDAGRRVRKILDEQGWTLKAILNTHSHADHIGGNAYLQKQTGCAIYAPAIEAAVAQHPLLEPTYLFGGCPPQELRNKFLMAQPSDVQVLHEDVLPEGFEIVPLPGHCFAQVGVRTPDNVVFIADSVSSEAILDKYGVTVLYDVAAQLETLDKLFRLSAAMYVPAHADPVWDIQPLLDANRTAILDVANTVLHFCENPIRFEDVLALVFAHYDLTMSTAQYALVGSTIKSYLAFLRDTGRVEIVTYPCQLRWQAVPGARVE